MMLLIAGGGFYALFEAKRRSANFRRLLDRILLKMPIIGDILYKSAVARFARTLSTMFAAGVPLVEAMDSVGKAAGNIIRSEEHTSELQSLMRISYAVFCLKKKTNNQSPTPHHTTPHDTHLTAP